MAEKEKAGNKTNQVNVFAAASFLNDFGSDMIYSVWPLFVTSVLGASLTDLGFLDGLGNALVSVSQAASGYYADRLKKRKIFIWLGYALGSLSRIGYAISTAWPQLIPFRIIDRAGKMRDSPRDAIVADVSTRSNRGGNFGFLRTMDNAGAVCGVIFAIFLLTTLGYRSLFLVAAIPSAISVLLVLLFIKERKPGKQKLYKGISFKDLTSNLKLFLVLSAIFALGSFSYSFLLIYANRLGIQAQYIPALYLAFTLLAALFSLPFGKLADKVGRKPVMLLSFAFWAFVCIDFILLKNVLGIILAFLLYGLHIGALDPVQRTFVSELAPKKYRASTLGGFQMIIGLCALPSSLAAGWLWDNLGPLVPFYASLGLTVLAAALLILVKEKA